MELKRIIINEVHDQQVIMLREVEGERSFPIVIGIFEATSIDRRVKGMPSPRPLTAASVARLNSRPSTAARASALLLSALSRPRRRPIVARSPSGTCSPCSIDSGNSSRSARSSNR